jgi:hypothetical protein
MGPLNKSVVDVKSISFSSDVNAAVPYRDRIGVRVGGRDKNTLKAAAAEDDLKSPIFLSEKSMFGLKLVRVEG